jgi:hypothetical protein
MLAVYINDKLIGCISSDDDDVALDWLQSQVDLKLDGEVSYDEDQGVYFIGNSEITLLYCDKYCRLD